MERERKREREREMCVVAIEKGGFESPFTMVGQLTYLYKYIICIYYFAKWMHQFKDWKTTVKRPTRIKAASDSIDNIWINRPTITRKQK